MDALEQQQAGLCAMEARALIADWSQSLVKRHNLTSYMNGRPTSKAPGRRRDTFYVSGPLPRPSVGHVSEIRCDGDETDAPDGRSDRSVGRVERWFSCFVLAMIG